MKWLFDDLPLPERGMLRRGVLYRLPAPRGWSSKRATDPDVLEAARRGQRKLLREYLERRRRAS
jgi:hypothetical protein